MNDRQGICLLRVQSGLSVKAGGRHHELRAATNTVRRSSGRSSRRSRKGTKHGERIKSRAGGDEREGDKESSRQEQGIKVASAIPAVIPGENRVDGRVIRVPTSRSGGRTGRPASFGLPQAARRCLRVVFVTQTESWGRRERQTATAGRQKRGKPQVRALGLACVRRLECPSTSAPPRVVNRSPASSPPQPVSY